jgi:alkylation response protein AidB-like acyl-CoA dehydrogenase
VQFRYDPEHESLREAIRRFLAETAGDGTTRQAMTSELGWDPDLVKRLAGELEVFSLAVPEAYGGSGYGVLELGIVFHEAGRSLLCAPLLSASIATRALLAAGDDNAAAAYLPRIATGDLLAAIAVREPGRDWDASPQVVATPTPTGWQLTGTKDWVVDGHAAELLIVSASTPAGASLLVVDPSAAGVDRTSIDTVDPTRRFATLTFTDTPATPLGAPGDGPRVLNQVRDVALVLIAAEQTGITERSLEIATSYAKTREQFGRAIGSFQAIKHKLATVQVELEAATSAAMYALWLADHEPGSLAAVARIAAYTCSESALLAASENIQVHGGIGATWEHSAHLYLRRATMNRQLFGDPQQHLEAIAEHLDLLPAMTGAP